MEKRCWEMTSVLKRRLGGHICHQRRDWRIGGECHFQVSSCVLSTTPPHPSISTSPFLDTHTLLFCQVKTRPEFRKATTCSGSSEQIAITATLGKGAVWVDPWLLPWVTRNALEDFKDARCGLTCFWRGTLERRKGVCKPVGRLLQGVGGIEVARLRV